MKYFILAAFVSAFAAGSLLAVAERYRKHLSAIRGLCAGAVLVAFILLLAGIASMYGAFYSAADGDGSVSRILLAFWFLTPIAAAWVTLVLGSCAYQLTKSQVSRRAAFHEQSSRN